jgi:hypothetical protein
VGYYDDIGEVKSQSLNLKSGITASGQEIGFACKLPVDFEVTGPREIYSVAVGRKSTLVHFPVLASHRTSCGRAPQGFPVRYHWQMPN